MTIKNQTYDSGLTLRTYVMSHNDSHEEDEAAFLEAFRAANKVRPTRLFADLSGWTMVGQFVEASFVDENDLVHMFYRQAANEDQMPGDIFSGDMGLIRGAVEPSFEGPIYEAFYDKRAPETNAPFVEAVQGLPKDNGTTLRYWRTGEHGLLEARRENHILVKDVMGEHLELMLGQLADYNPADCTIQLPFGGCMPEVAQAFYIEGVRFTQDLRSIDERLDVEGKDGRKYSVFTPTGSSEITSVGNMCDAFDDGDSTEWGVRHWKRYIMGEGERVAVCLLVEAYSEDASHVAFLLPGGPDLGHKERAVEEVLALLSTEGTEDLSANLPLQGNMPRVVGNAYRRGRMPPSIGHTRDMHPLDELKKRTLM